MRGRQPEVTQWFLPHSDVRHGEYPLHYTREAEIIAELHEHKLWTEIGFHVRLSGLSYGAIDHATVLRP